MSLASEGDSLEHPVNSLNTWDYPGMSLASEGDSLEHSVNSLNTWTILGCL